MPAVYVCRKIRLYDFLTKKGFKPFKQVTDKNDCKRLVWLYEDTPDLQTAVKEYYSEIPQKNK